MTETIQVIKSKIEWLKDAGIPERVILGLTADELEGLYQMVLNSCRDRR